MSWSEHDLKQVFLTSLEASPGADCPAPEAIWDALNLAVPARRRYRIVLHTTQCRHCAQAWQAAKIIAQESRLRTAPVEPRVPRWRRWLSPPVLAPALAGVAAVLVALVWLAPRDLGPVAPPVDSGVLRGLGSAPEPLTEDGAMLAAGDALSWHRVAGAIHHKVVLHSDDGQHRLELPAGDRLVIDTEVIEFFGAGQPVYWYVVALDGAEPGSESEVRAFTIRARD